MSNLKLVEHLASVGNKSGSIKSAPMGMSRLKEAIEGLPFDVSTPAMSKFVNAGDVVKGSLKIAEKLGGLHHLGNFSQIFGRIQTLTGDVSNLDDLKKKISEVDVGVALNTDELRSIVGSVTSIVASVVSKD